MEKAIPPYARWGAAHFLAWGGLWLLPMVLCALPETFPRFPSPYLRVFYRLSALFPNRSKVWSNYYVQGRTSASTPWVSLNPIDYDPLVVWGYENRLQRMVSESANYGQRGERFRQRMAAFVAAKHASLYPQAPPLVEVRFVRASWTVGGSESMRHPAGRWRITPLELVPPEQQRVMSTHWTGPEKLPAKSKPVVAVKAKSDAKRAPIPGLSDEGLQAALAAGKAQITINSSSRVSPAGLRQLWTAKSVKTLFLTGRKLSKEDMTGLGGMTQLESLDLSASGFPTDGLEDLLKLTNLRFLSLRGTRLRGTRLRGTRLRSSDLARLTALPLIERFDASHAPEALPMLMHAGKWPRLQELDLRAVKGMGPVLAAMPPHPALRKLDLSETDLTSADLEKLARHPKLETLLLDGTAVDDTAIPWIAAMTQLRAVSVAKAGVSEAGSRQLAAVHHLEQVRTGERWQKLAKPATGKAEPSKK